MQESQTIQTEYNLNMTKSMLISNLQNFASLKYVSDDYYGSFKHWKAIRLLISNRLKDTQVTTLIEKEKEIMNQALFKNDKKQIRLKKQFPLEKLDEYILKIQITLKKIGLDIIDKQDLLF